MPVDPLGYDTALRALYNTALKVLKVGRAEFFEGDDEGDLPNRPTSATLVRKDDRMPQFGYVGESYRAAEVKVLILGINPGNGPDERSEADKQMMPVLINFAEHPSLDTFDKAQKAVKAACVNWPMWPKRCSEVIGPGKLELEEVVFSNFLPWRTNSQCPARSVMEKAAELYACLLIKELQPTLIIALGKCTTKCTTKIFQLLAGQKLPELITWNLARVATEAVKEERAIAAAKILTVLGRRQGN